MATHAALRRSMPLRGDTPRCRRPGRPARLFDGADRDPPPRTGVPGWVGRPAAATPVSGGPDG